MWRVSYSQTGLLVLEYMSCGRLGSCGVGGCMRKMSQVGIFLHIGLAKVGNTIWV